MNRRSAQDAELTGARRERSTAGKKVLGMGHYVRVGKLYLVVSAYLWQRHNVTASDRLRGLITLPLSSNVGWRIAVFVPDGRLRVFCVTEKARI